MNNGAFGENFPYSNFHDLNLDWMIKIVKDFLDQYTHIQELIANGEADITELTQESLTELQNKAEELDQLLQDWYDDHSEDIAQALNTALANLSAETTASIARFNSRAEQYAQAVIATIPSDYTAQNAKIERLNNDLLITKRFSIMPTEATGHGYYDNTGTYHENSQYSSFYVPMRGNAVVYMDFGGTTATHLHVCSFDINGGFLYDHGQVYNRIFMTPEATAYIGYACKTVDLNTLNVRTLSTHYGIDFLCKDLYRSTVNITPASPDTHGFYDSDGSFNADAGWDGYYIPVLPNCRYNLTFSGTSHPRNHLCEYNRFGQFIRDDGRTRNVTFDTSADTFFIGCATTSAQSGAVRLEYVTTKTRIFDVLNTFSDYTSQGIMTTKTMQDERTQRPLSNVPANTTIYFRVLSTTDPTINGLSMYGLNTGNSAVSLGFAEVGGGIVKAVTDRAYENIQMALNPYPSGSFSGTIEYSILVDNVMGITPDAYEAYEGSVIRNLNTHTMNMFKRVCCIGDSYCAGYINYNGVIETHPEYSWPSFMEKLTGNEYINCGVNGANVLTWQSNVNGLAKAQTAGRVQAYIIGLLINDTSDSERGVPLGSASDIGTNNQTYYGGLSKIIREVNAISPTAKIFVTTCPKASSGNAYNEAIRTIVETYASTYPVYLIDLVKETKIWKQKSFTNDYVGGHYTAIGYEQMAEGLNYIISKYMDNHITEFQNIHKIPYDS